jgi:hypothetical protein
MRLTAPCFGRLTSMIVGVADDCCAGRAVAITEGGYDPQGLAESLRETIAALDGGSAGGVAAGAVLKGRPYDQTSDQTALKGRPRYDHSNDQTERADETVNADTSRGRATLNAVLPAVSPYWRL